MDSQNINRQIYESVNKVTLVPSGASTSKRGKGAGFYCEICDLTFKDSIDYSDHLISRQHTNNAGIEIVTKRATLEDVKKRLEMLRKKHMIEHEQFDIKKRLNERKQSKKEDKPAKNAKQEEPELTAEQIEMKKVMGFSSFD